MVKCSKCGEIMEFKGGLKIQVKLFNVLNAKI